VEHGPATEWKEDAKTSKFKSKIGLWMFLGYTVVYAIFIILNVMNPKLMGKDIGMVNLAIIYGFGLIILAVIMSLIYNALCGSVEGKALKLEKMEYRLHLEEEHRLKEEEERRLYIQEEHRLHEEEEKRRLLDEERKSHEEGEHK